MTIAKLSLLQCIVPKRYAAPITQMISILGVTEAQSIKELQLQSRGVEPLEDKDRSNRCKIALSKTINLMNYLELAPRKLSEKIDPAIVNPLSDEDFQKLSLLEQRAKGIVERINILKREKERLENYTTKIKMLQGINVEMDVLKSLRFSKYFFGRLPTAHLPRLLRGLGEVKESILEILQRGKEDTFIFVITSAKRAKRVERILKASFCEIIDIPLKFTGHPEDMLKNIEIEQERTDIAIKNFRLKLHRIGLANHEWIYALWNKLKWSEFILRTNTMFGKTRHFSILSLWVPEEHKEKIEREIDKITQGRNICEWVDAKEARKRYKKLRIPTLLKNRGIFKPFELLISAYGIPRYTEIDPTPLVAITFTFMFGMMFGDVGHGAALTLLGYILQKSLKKRAHGFLKLLIICGISSILWGALYGSLFGYEDVIPAIWTSPMHDVLRFLGISIVWGIIMLITGYTLNIVNKVKEERIKELFKEEKGVPGITFYLSIILTMICWVEKWNYYIPMAIALGILGIMFLQELKEGGGVFEVFIKLFSFVIENISNTISFIRVGAFALNHVALSMVIFTLSNMITPTSTGLVIRIMIIIFGNLLIILFEGFIVGIQVTRLEFYEFFSKFYQGDGRRFKPLSYIKE